LISWQFPTNHQHFHNDLGQVITTWTFKHSDQRNGNWNPYPILHHIIVNIRPRLVVNCKNFITIYNNILSSPHYYFSCPHHFLMHEFFHCPTRVITPVLFAIFWYCQ
jgi:hypothetical protein